MNKTIATSIILSLFIVAVFFYWKGRNTRESVIKPAQSAQSGQETGPIDGTSFYKKVYQNSNEVVKSALSKTPLNVDADKSKLAAYKELKKLGEDYKQPLISALAAEKIAEVTNLDTNFFKAGNEFMNASVFTEDANLQKYYLTKAKENYKASVSLNPNSIAANNSLAVAIIQLGEDPPMVGIGYLKKSLEIDSMDFGTNYLYGQMLVMSTQYKKALKVYNKLINLQPSNAELVFTLSDIYGKMGETEKAKLYLDKAKQLNNK